MKKTICLICLLTGLYANALSSTPDSIKNELTISSDIISFSSGSLKFSHRLSSSLWIKAGVIYLGRYEKSYPQIATTFPVSEGQYNLGLILGLDRHKMTKMEKIEFIYGMNLRFSLANNTSKIDNPQLAVRLRKEVDNYYQAGAGFTFGLYYNFSRNFSVGSEANPYLMIAYAKNYGSFSKRTGLAYNLTSNISIISLKYRWD